MVPGEKNVINEPLVDRKNIILPPLHIKLGIMKQFIKAFDRDGDCIQCSCSTFPRVSDEKKTAGIFNGPQIRTLLKDKHFMARMTAVEARAGVAFTNVVQGFLANKKDDNYKEIVDELLLSLQGLGCRLQNEHQTALLTQSLGQVSRQPWRCQRGIRQEVPSRH